MEEGLDFPQEEQEPRVPSPAHNSGSIPLPERVRPTTPADLLGQEKIWGERGALRRLVEQDRFHALLFWGPPGTGKTSLARLIGAHSGRPVAPMSAVLHGVKDIREQIARSLQRIEAGQSCTILFMDEIHRLSKSQQDVLLPALEQGSVKFIGATTENPSFTVNAAILSRCLVFRLEALDEAALVAVLRRALAHPQSGGQGRAVADDVLVRIARAADGDARRALNLLDAVLGAAGDGAIDASALAEVAATLNLRYDRQADAHYDTISAFIKSIRASQPDAALYYLARMLESGEDPVFVGRRLMIAASEDVGNANPTALLLATAAMTAAQQLGMPEARIPLAQATTYLAASPKSNRAYVGINKAMEDVRSTGSLEIPMHLRNAPTKLMKESGYGQGYVYAHDDQVGAQGLEYLPEGLRGKVYYEPLMVGAEGQLRKTLEVLRGAGEKR